MILYIFFPNRLIRKLVDSLSDKINLHKIRIAPTDLFHRTRPGRKSIHVWSAILSKIMSNKSCWAFNFVPKSHWMHISVTPGRGAGILQRLVFSKYCYVQKRQSKFTLEPNTAKNTHHFKIISNKSC